MLYSTDAVYTPLFVLCSKSEVHEEGRRGLKPLQEKAGGSDRESPDPPSFSAMLQYFHKRVCVLYTVYQIMYVNMDHESIY